MLNRRRGRFLQEALCPSPVLNGSARRRACAFHQRCRRQLLLAILLLACGGHTTPSLGAVEERQADVASWNAVATMATGVELRVATGRDARVSGRLIRVSEDSIVVQSPRVGPVTISRSQVTWVEMRKRRRDSLLNGALIGAVAGLAYGGIGTAIASRGGDSPAGNRAVVVGITGAVGAGVGALADRLRENVWVRVYELRSNREAS